VLLPSLLPPALPVRSREAVRRRYALVREVLRLELGTTPSERTRTLYERLMEQGGGDREDHLPDHVAS